MPPLRPLERLSPSDFTVCRWCQRRGPNAGCSSQIANSGQRRLGVLLIVIAALKPNFVENLADHVVNGACVGRRRHRNALKHNAGSLQKVIKIARRFTVCLPCLV